MILSIWIYLLNNKIFDRLYIYNGNNYYQKIFIISNWHDITMTLAIKEPSGHHLAYTTFRC